MKKIFLILMAIFVSLGASAEDKEGGSGQEGNGGGGVRGAQNQYMTFYSIQFPREAISAEKSEYESLNTRIEQLEHFLQRQSTLPRLQVMRILRFLRPSSLHEYVKIRSLDGALERRIREEFARVHNSKADDIQLYAVTDIPRLTTFILPTFFRLSPVEQMAILFHEVYWMLYRHATYEQVVAAEMAFQAHLEKPQDLATTRALLEYLD